MSSIQDCKCGQFCSCYYRDRKCVTQHQEDDPENEKSTDNEGLIVTGVICVVTYETGEVQRLRRPWLDMNPQPYLLPKANV